MRRNWKSNTTVTEREPAQVTRNLPCVLTGQEIGDKARFVAISMQEYSKLEEEAKESAAEFKSRLKGIRERMDKESECVSTGIEHRGVQCIWEFYPARGEKELIRLDTGDVVQVKRMSDEELQVALPMMDALSEHSGEGNANDN